MNETIYTIIICCAIGLALYAFYRERVAKGRADYYKRLHTMWRYKAERNEKIIRGLQRAEKARFDAEQSLDVINAEIIGD